MTYLELVKMLHLEAGISGLAPSAVVGLTGESARLANWINRAWHELQLDKKEWLFMRGQFSFNSTAGDGKYSPLDAGIATRFRRFEKNAVRMFKTDLGVNDEYRLAFMDYETFRDMYLTGIQQLTRPRHFSFDANLDLLIGNKPDATYTISGEYYKKPQTLVDAGDIPDMPEEFHSLIAYRALEKYASFEAAPEVLSYSKRMASPIYNQLLIDQLPDVRLGAPLLEC